MPYRSKPHPKVAGRVHSHVYWGQVDVPLEEIIDECHAFEFEGTPIPKAEIKLMRLAHYVRYLVGEVHALNNERPPEQRQDLCPMCAQRTWGRPTRHDAGFDDNPDWQDFERRECKTCHFIRPEPPEPEREPAPTSDEENR